MRARAHRVFDHLRRQWTGTLALFLVLTGGVAYAANTVGSSDVIDESLRSQDIKNGEVKVADVGQGAVATDEIASGQVKATDIGDGEVKSAEIANGQVQAQDLAAGVAPGASGARAWGLVDPFGGVLRSKQVTSVTNADPGSGTYCIDPAPGIDPQTAVMVVSTAFETGRTDTTNDSATLAQWDPANTICPATAMQVRTFLIAGTAPSGSELDFGGFNLIVAFERFSFVIP